MKSKPNIDDIVTFLEDEGALRPGPGSTFAPDMEEPSDERMIPVDWEGVLPKGGLLAPVSREDERFGFSPNDGWEVFDDPEWRRLSIDDPWNPQITEQELEEFIDGLDEEFNPEAEGKQPHFDVCAWYRQIHFAVYDWGIYVKSDCVRTMGKSIGKCLPYHYKKSARKAPSHLQRTLYRQCMRSAFWCLYLHEIYHHKVECFGIRLQAVQGRGSYVRYKDNVYFPLKLKGDDRQLEEALANAHCYLNLDRKPYKDCVLSQIRLAAKKYLKLVFPFHPPGYREAVKYLKKKEFSEGEKELQCRIQEGTLNHTLNPERWSFANRMMQEFFDVRSEIYEIVPPSRAGGLLPPSSALPFFTCSTKDLVKVCGRLGWSVKKGGKGSHVKLTKAKKSRPITIPGNRKAIPPGTLSSIKRALNIDEGQLKVLLSS